MAKILESRAGSEFEAAPTASEEVSAVVAMDGEVVHIVVSIGEIIGKSYTTDSRLC